jgi:hypothetical protein
MHPPSISRMLCGFGVLLLLGACGGGGSGDSPDPPGPGGNNPPPPPASAPTFSVATKSLDFASGIPNNTPPPRKILASISGPVNGSLSVLSSTTVANVSIDVSYVNQSGQTPTINIVATPVSANLATPGIYTGTVTLVACVDDSTCQTGQLPGSPQTVNVTYSVESNATFVQGDVVAPRIVMAGQAGTLRIRGRGLSGATDVRLGSTSATNVQVDSLAGDTTVRVTYPALPAGSYPVTVNSGAIPFTGTLVVVNPPSYAATVLQYPSMPQEIGGLFYDARQEALFVAARYADSQANQVLKFQRSGTAWLAPVAVSVPKIQDIALSADGTVLLVVTDTAMMEFDPATLAALGTCPVADNLVNAGTAYLQNLAVANDGYAFVTTGGANPSHEFLYSATRHAFITLTSANTSPAASLDPRLYFGNPGVSGDGSLVAITQDPRSMAQSPMSTRPFLYVYDTVGQRSGFLGFRSATYTDRDRSQLPRSAKPALDREGKRIVLNGPSTVVLDRAYGPRGTLPSTTRAVAVKPDASRAFTFDAPNGSDAGMFLTFDLTTSLTGDAQYPPIDAGIPMTPGNGTGAIAMTISPDGGTVFVAGVSGVYVQPVP